MTTLEVQPKAFPTSIPSTVSHNQATTGFGSILPSHTDDSSLGDRADLRWGFANDWRTEPTLVAREAEEIRIRYGPNVSTQDKNIGQSSKILATRRGLSSSTLKRTPKRPPGRSPFAKFGTRSSQLPYGTEDFINSQDPSPESKGREIFNFNIKSAPDSDTEDIVRKFSPEDWEGKFEARDYFTTSRNQGPNRTVRRDRVESANTFPREPFTEDEDSADLDSDNEHFAPAGRARAESPNARRLRRRLERNQNRSQATQPSYTYEDLDSPPNELATLSQKFGKMGWGMRKGNAMSHISPTISKDNTLGECVRNAKLLADFAKKHQRFAFGSGAQAPENFAEGSDTLIAVS
jgi:hypothetical protein